MTMSVRIFDDRFPDDSRRRATDPYLAHFRSTHPLLVIQGPRIPWVVCRGLLVSLAIGLGSSGLVLFNPWAPEANEKRQRFLAEYPSGAILSWECIATGPTSQTFPMNALEVREALGGARSGTWLLGVTADSTASERLQDPELRADPITAVAEQLSDTLPFCLSIDEGDFSTLFLHLTPTTIEYADALKKTVDTVV